MDTSRSLLTVVIPRSRPPVLQNRPFSHGPLSARDNVRLLHVLRLLDGSKMELELIPTEGPYPFHAIFSPFSELPDPLFCAHFSVGLVFWFFFFYSSCSLYILDASPFFVRYDCMFLGLQFSSFKLFIVHRNIFTKAIQVIWV